MLSLREMREIWDDFVDKNSAVYLRGTLDDFYAHMERFDPSWTRENLDYLYYEALRPEFTDNPFMFRCLGLYSNLLLGRKFRRIMRERLAKERAQKPKPSQLPESLKKLYAEGESMLIAADKYEHDPQARLKCVSFYGCKCQICGFNFENTYGKIGHAYIQIHHMQPTEIREDPTKVDPIKDLIPVCANCHAMIHQRSPEPYLPKDIRKRFYSIRNAQRKEAAPETEVAPETSDPCSSQS